MAKRFSQLIILLVGAILLVGPSITGGLIYASNSLVEDEFEVLGSGSVLEKTKDAAEDEFVTLGSAEQAPGGAKPSAYQSARGRRRGGGGGGGPRGWAALGLWEYAGAAFVAAYGLRYLAGRRESARVVAAWEAACGPALLAQFAEVGPATDGPGAAAGGALLHWESPGERLAWASGRRRCAGALLRLRLAPRHDLLAPLLALAGVGAGAAGLPPTGGADTLHLEVALAPPPPGGGGGGGGEAAGGGGGALPAGWGCPGVGAAARRRRDLRALAGARPDLKAHAAIVECKNLPASISAMADSSEVMDKLFTPQFAEVIEENKDLFQHFHFTSENKLNMLGFASPPRLMMRFAFTVPKKLSEMHRLVALIEMAMAMVDHVHTVKLSAKLPAYTGNVVQTIDSSDSIQKSIEAAKSREAAAQKEAMRRRAGAQRELAEERRAERRRLDRAAYELMTPEQQAKHDAKEEKKKVKEAQKRKMKMKRI